MTTDDGCKNTNEAERQRGSQNECVRKGENKAEADIESGGKLL